MEEKERYTIESFEIEEPPVIFDNKAHQIILTLVDYNYDEISHLEDLLNQQNKRNQQLKQQVEELKGKRLEFYNDDVRQTQVINGVHFDIEQLLVFSEYVEHSKNISADKDKQINQLKQQLHDLPKKIVEDIEKNFTEYLPLKDKTGAGFYGQLNAILKKYGGEKIIWQMK